MIPYIVLTMLRNCCELVPLLWLVSYSATSSVGDPLILSWVSMYWFAPVVISNKFSCPQCGRAPCDHTEYVIIVRCMGRKQLPFDGIRGDK